VLRVFSSGASVRSYGGAAAHFSFSDRGSANVQVAEIDASGGVDPYATVTPGWDLPVGMTAGPRAWATDARAAACGRSQN